MEEENQIFCIKLKRKEKALINPPLPGELGEKILEQVSAKAWSLWLIEQTKIINELQLSLALRESRQLLKQRMCRFLGLVL